MSLPARAAPEPERRALGARFRAWVGETEAGEPWFRFVAVFFGIWCAYDCLDLAWGGTAASYWLVAGAEQTLKSLRFLQLSLFCSELALVLGVVSGRMPRAGLVALLGGCTLLRWLEAHYFFELNDFLYYVVTAFILIQFFPAGRGGRLARWPRTLLRFQTAWIYFATGVLKLNTHWLSGDHLWVRLNYLAHVLHWPFPAWIQSLVSRLEFDRGLAIAGAAGELTMALALLIRTPRWFQISLAVAMHGFAALALNVWFFGASMVAQVVFVSASAPPTPNRSS